MTRLLPAFLAAARLATVPLASQAQMTPSQALDRRRIDGLVATRDGRVAAFTVAEPAKGTERIRHIFLYRVGDPAASQFTRSDKSEWAPQFSPAGDRIAFLSNRGERPAIWIMSLDGGEAQLVPSGKIAVDRFEWAPDGQSIAFLGPPPKTEGEEKRLKEKDDARVVDRDSLPALWVIDVGTNAIRRLTRPPWQVAEFAWLPSGGRLALVATDSSMSDRWTDRLFLIGATDSAPSQVAAPKGPIGGLRALAGGLTFTAARQDGPTPHDLWYQPLDGGQARNLTGASLDRPVRSLEWADGPRAAAIVESGFTSRIEWIDLDGRHVAGPTLPIHPSEVVPVADGGLLVIGERTTQPAEVWLVNRAGEARTVTDVNRAAAALTPVDPELFRYRSFDGTEIEAALLVPKNRQPAQRLPLVVLVHGGPTGAWEDRFETWGQLLVARGYAVLYPNIRGSTGYGWKFVVANRSDWGGGDFKDVMAGVDTLIARGIADPARLGIGGWSYGGYMASWAITQTTRFKAAVTGAGMSDLAVEYGTEQGPAYDEWFYGTPYERPQGFKQSSPLTYIARARTPTLILQGEDDLTDPISQSQMLYRALKRYGVPTELVLYPREGHGLREEKHLIDRLSRIVDWFARWLR